jgi:hypothetical protein
MDRVRKSVSGAVDAIATMRKIATLRKLVTPRIQRIDTDTLTELYNRYSVSEKNKPYAQRAAAALAIRLYDSGRSNTDIFQRYISEAR